MTVTNLDEAIAAIAGMADSSATIPLAAAGSVTTNAEIATPTIPPEPITTNWPSLNRPARSVMANETKV
ncbi:hypothetical protein ACTHRK_15670 [Dietzia cercidiphylli]|uniref:hypothetical protein n=1 Tax=Dietzia cercidiphylli TaxID=498199 RepID=UPI003F7DB126